MSITATMLRHTGNLLVIALLAACAARHPAPVSDSRPTAPPRASAAADSKPAADAQTPKPVESERVHVIQKGDTLIGVAFQNGLDFRELAAWNNIENPNVIKLGETLRLTAPGAPVIVAGSSPQPKPGEPVVTPLILTPMPTAANPTGNTDKFKTEPKASKVPYSDAAYAKLSAEAAAATAAAAASSGAAPVSGALTPAPAPTPPPIGIPAAVASDEVSWAWPIQPPPKGRIIANFTDANRGIDISGTRNAPVLAAAAGKVVHTGAGLRGYGRLIIIKHNDSWLSAYAHNEKILVMDGQTVSKGQTIAEMGSSDAEQVKLHFEIRRQGKPVDPLKFLPN